MEGKENGIDVQREVAALRHTFHIDGRLRLEFLSTVSKLLRDHEVPVSNRLLSALILAVPDELSEGDAEVSEDGTGVPGVVPWQADAATVTEAAAGTMVPRPPVVPVTPKQPVVPLTPKPPVVPVIPKPPKPPIPPRPPVLPRPPRPPRPPK